MKTCNKVPSAGNFLKDKCFNCSKKERKRKRKQTNKKLIKEKNNSVFVLVKYRPAETPDLNSKIERNKISL